MKCLWIYLTLLLLTVVQAHESVSPVQLAGVRPCVQTSSVQLGLEAVPVGADAEGIKQEVYSYLTRSLQRARVPFDDLCPGNPHFVLVSIYARFLDPETYLGFPPSSYTYLISGQLGMFSPQPTPETVLTPSLYATSVSEIFQAEGARALEQRLVLLGRAQVDDFLRHYHEANTVPLLFYGLFAALGTALVSLRLLPLLIR